MKLSKHRLKEIILEELREAYSREDVNSIINAPGSSETPGTLREPWDGIEENAGRLDILSKQIGQIAMALGVEL
jgi:hypothetical protein|tara:strand:+ start:798 stop:1019 length:222 start_codon:yes stop_codon:yes gene_type:complete